MVAVDVPSSDVFWPDDLVSWDPQSHPVLSLHPSCFTISVNVFFFDFLGICIFFRMDLKDTHTHNFDESQLNEISAVQSSWLDQYSQNFLSQRLANIYWLANSWQPNICSEKVDRVVSVGVWSLDWKDWLQMVQIETTEMVASWNGGTPSRHPILIGVFQRNKPSRQFMETIPFP